jgi:hypothetical protein
MPEEKLPPLDQLLRPLSAKVGRPKFSPGGREIATRGSCGDGNKLSATLRRLAADAERRKGQKR